MENNQQLPYQDAHLNEMLTVVPSAMRNSQGRELRFSPLSASANLLREKHQIKEAIPTRSARELLENNVLIVGPAWIGDMVMSQCLYRLLKQRDSALQIDVLAPDWSRPLLEHMPEVRHIYSMPLTHGQLGLLARYRLGKRLRQQHYRQAIVLPNSFKSALIPWFAKIPLRTGWRGEMRYGLINDLRILDKQKYPLMIDRFMALGLPAGEACPVNPPWPKLAVTESEAQEILEKFHCPKDQRKILALGPGAQFGPAKCWPSEHFAALANHYLEAGWQVWLLGAKDDLAAAATIQQKTQERCVSFIGQTTLSDVMALLSNVDGVVCNDSGLMHIAAALNVPLVAIYGSSSPTFTPPLSRQVRILWLKKSCSPCFKRICPEDHYHCLTEITPEIVSRAIEELQGF